MHRRLTALVLLTGLSLVITGESPLGECNPVQAFSANGKYGRMIGPDRAIAIALANPKVKTPLDAVQADFYKRGHIITELDVSVNGTNDGLYVVTLTLQKPSFEPEPGQDMTGDMPEMEVQARIDFDGAFRSYEVNTPDRRFARFRHRSR